MESPGDFRDTLYTIDKKGRRRWVYPQYAPGFFFKKRTVVAYSLMIFYLALPWITIAGKQGVLLDIPHRRFIFFGIELWATDTIFLFLVFALAGMSLFFFTATLGRVWCGWACPETVFLEFLFRPIERLIEGNDAARRKLDSAPWNANKIIRKGLKHLFCAGASWVIASTALAYFIGREPLLEMMTHSPFANPGPFFMTVALMGVMAFQFGWFREQFCTVLCPYARFQSVLMDQNSLLVGYDAKRGEPRSKGRAKSENAGDCVDCGMCVRVCPTGIDIRNGTQLECIACTACIDACDSIMEKLSRPTGLIRYSTEAKLRNVAQQSLRPRILVYAAIICVLASIFIYKLESRSLLDFEIVRAGKDQLMSQNSSSSFTNQFTVKLANKGEHPVTFQIKTLNASIQIVSPLTQLELKPEEVQQVPMFISAPSSVFSNGQAHVTLEFASSVGETFVRELTLFGGN